MAFADHYTRADFAAGLAIEEDASGNLRRAHVDEVFVTALKAHLLALRSEGRLGVTGGVAGRDVWVATDWNDFVATGELSRWLPSAIGEMLGHSALVRGSPREGVEATAEKVDSVWSSLCTILDEGTTGFRIKLDMFDWRLEGVQDANSGDRCRLDFTGWKAQLMRQIDKGLEPAQDIGAIPLAEIEFDCPSGEILLTDCLSAADDAFRDAIDLGDRAHTDASRNSIQGSILASTIIAGEYGFAEISTDNTNVVVHVQGDRIVVSDRWADENLRLDDADGDVTVAGWTKAGAFSCDRWTVIAADRQVVVDQLEKAGVTMAADALDLWLVEEGDEVVVLKVTPGRYRVRFGPDFSKRFDRAQAGIPNGPEPWLIMERIG